MDIPYVNQERLDVVKVKEKFPNAVIKVKQSRDDLYICIHKENLTDVLQFIKEDEELQYTYFSECVGVDYSTWKHERDFDHRFEVVYNLMSLKYNSRLFIKVGVNDGETVPTAKNIYLGAEYPEREIWDLLGIVFKGNEQNQRFLLPDDWVGHPLRKEVPLGGDNVVFAENTLGPAVQDVSSPHAGESFEGKTGSEDVSGR